MTVTDEDKMYVVSLYKTNATGQPTIKKVKEFKTCLAANYQKACWENSHPEGYFVDIDQE